MRHCFGENVRVYETVGETLGSLLRDAANLVDSHDGWAQVVTGPNLDDTGWSVTVYLHS